MATTKEKLAQTKYRTSDKYRQTRWVNHIKKTYNLSIQDYESILISQNYTCKLCNRAKVSQNWKFDDKRIDLYVDHCHKTNKVRGLLCHKCNVAIGMFEDNIDVMAKAIAYIKEHNVEHN